VPAVQKKETCREELNSVVVGGAEVVDVVGMVVDEEGEEGELRMKTPQKTSATLTPTSIK
jgi:hypothetical protein